MVDCTPFPVIITVCDVRCRVGDEVGAVSGSVCVPTEQLRFVFDRAGHGNQWKIIRSRIKKKRQQIAIGT